MSLFKEAILETVENNLDRQISKGLKTYGHLLEDCPNDKYDWNDMLMQEMIDALQYQQKIIQILKLKLEESGVDYERAIGKK